MEELINGPSEMSDFKSQYERDLEEHLPVGEAASPMSKTQQMSKVPPLTIKTFRHDKKKDQVVQVAAKKQALPNELTKEERQTLTRYIKEFTANLEKEIEEKYPDSYKETIMMDS